jgi:hypothetical protein
MQGCTAARAPVSAGGCSHWSAPPYGPSSPLSSRRRTPRRRDGSTGPSEGQSPKKPLQTAAKMAACAMEEGDETDHIPWRRSRVSLARGGHPLRLRPIGEGTEQTVSNEGLQILHSDDGERPRVARRNDGHLVSHHRTEVLEAEGMRCVVSFSLAALLGCGNQSRRQAQMAG